MYLLILSITCSVAVSILLKIARRHSINVAQAIAVNYLVAITFCLILLQPSPASLIKPDNAWGVLAALGILLPTIFLAMAGAVRHAGIVLSDAAQRLSLFIPLIASFVLFGEQLSSSKAIGITVALTALICLILRPKDKSVPGETLKSIGFLLSVWVGYGVIDILFKQMAKTGAAFASSLLISFAIAAVVIFAYLIAKRSVWSRRNVVAGVILGALNFGNIYFYIRAHQVFPDNPTLVFSAMNIGVISLGTIVGAGFFKEKLSWINILGIALAISAIVLLIPR